LHYFDHSSTTPIHPDVIELINKIQKNNYGNPSSIHKKGRIARSIIENSRLKVANAIGTEPEKIIFTSGGTESNNQVLWSRLGKKKRTILFQT
jgi:cysteine desulfurase